MTTQTENAVNSVSGSLTVARIPVPASLDAPDARAFLAIARLSNAMARHDAGHPYLDMDPAELLAPWQDQSDHGHDGFYAERDGEIVGVATLEIPLEDAATDIEFEIAVDPERWGEGIEEALLAAVEQEARDRSRPVLQVYSLHRPEHIAHPTGGLITPPTGFGAVPAEDRQTRFFVEQGFTLEQVERNSVFDLTGPFDTVERMLADALEFAGDDYRLVTWTSPTPGEFKDGFAYAISRMSTDVPTGNLVWTEETWDAARVERRDARLRAGGLTVSVACVQHVATGVIAAYNELVLQDDPTASTHQWGTLVLKEHRGHRLGTIVKCANLLRWREVAPHSPRVSTFNAEENRPMLDINEAIGFVPASYAGGWKKIIELEESADTSGRSDSTGS